MAKILGREDETSIFQELECNLLGRDFIPPLASVHVDGPHRVDWETLVRIDGDTEEAGVGVDQPLDVPLVQVEEDGGVVEVGQVGHVLAAVVLGRVDLGHEVLLVGVGFALPGALDDHDRDLGASGLLDETLSDLLLGVRDVTGSHR